MGITTRAIRDISRKKIRTSLVIALSFSRAILIPVPAGVIASQENVEGENA